MVAVRQYCQKPEHPPGINVLSDIHLKDTVKPAAGQKVRFSKHFREILKYFYHGTVVAKPCNHMKNNSFDRAMGQIVAQAEAERQQEIKAVHRAEWFARVRKAFFYLFIVTVAIFTYNFHDQMGTLIATVMPAKTAPAAAPGATTQPTAKVAVALLGAAQNAAVRDSLIDGLAK
jgi:hypothetical protein